MRRLYNIIQFETQNNMILRLARYNLIVCKLQRLTVRQCNLFESLCKCGDIIQTQT